MGLSYSGSIGSKGVWFWPAWWQQVLKNFKWEWIHRPKAELNFVTSTLVGSTLSYCNPVDTPSAILISSCCSGYYQKDLGRHQWKTDNLYTNKYWSKLRLLLWLTDPNHQVGYKWNFAQGDLGKGFFSLESKYVQAVFVLLWKTFCELNTIWQNSLRYVYKALSQVKIPLMHPLMLLVTWWNYR